MTSKSNKEGEIFKLEHRIHALAHRRSPVPGYASPTCPRALSHASALRAWINIVGYPLACFMASFPGIF